MLLASVRSEIFKLKWTINWSLYPKMLTLISCMNFFSLGIEAFGYPTYFLFLDSSTESETNMKDMVLCARKRKTGNSSYIIATSLENLNSEIFVGKLKSNNLIGTRYDSGIVNLSSKKGSETGFLAQNLDRILDMT